MRQFVPTTVAEAMAATYFGHSRQLINSVTSSAEIEAQFDGVAYAFGASTLRMLKNYLDRTRPGTYIAGMGEYFAAHAFGNAEPPALWSALAGASGLTNLDAYMTSYTSQTGYPLLTVAWSDANSASTGVGSLTVAQSRHFLSAVAAAAAIPGTANPVWWVPLTMYGEHPASSGPVPLAVQAAYAEGGFTTPAWSQTIGSADNTYSLARDGWVKLNVNASGYARVQYPLNMWRAFAASITAQLQAGNLAAPLSPADRGQLVSDLFIFAFGTQWAAGGITMAEYLRFIAGFLTLEQSYEVLVPAVSSLLHLRALLTADATPLAGDACVNALTQWAQAALLPLAQRLNFTGDQSPLTVMTRSSVLSAASGFGVQWVVNQANALYAGGITNISPNIQTTVLASAVRWAPDASVYNNLRSQYIATKDAAVKRRYMAAMAATRDTSLLQSLLADSLNPDVVRTSDTVGVIVTVAANNVGRALAWNFVQQNWVVLNRRYGSGGFALSDLVYGSTSNLQSQASLQQVQSFFASNPVPGAALDLQQTQEMISSNIAWSNADRASTCAWLQQPTAA
jgi:aminopeptidase N